MRKGNRREPETEAEGLSPCLLDHKFLNVKCDEFPVGWRCQDHESAGLVAPIAFPVQGLPSEMATCKLIKYV